MIVACGFDRSGAGVSVAACKIRGIRAATLTRGLDRGY
jgi:ribose 5-phosphate isomerase RpiB